MVATNTISSPAVPVPGEEAARFPTLESESVRQSGQKLQELIRKTVEWAAIPGAPGIDKALLRRWQRDVRLLTRSAARPPALGVFGESQVGKSYLISCFSGSDQNDLMVQDP